MNEIDRIKELSGLNESGRFRDQISEISITSDNLIAHCEKAGSLARDVMKKATNGNINLNDLIKTMAELESQLADIKRWEARYKNPANELKKLIYKKMT